MLKEIGSAREDAAAGGRGLPSPRVFTYYFFLAAFFLAAFFLAFFLAAIISLL